MLFKKFFIIFVQLVVVTTLATANTCPKWFPMPSSDMVVVIPIYDASITGPDMDCDGLVDSVDPDIDGDGVANASDPFPLNDSEWLDTDGDGVENNTDTDDDGDGISDIVEIANGSNPVDSTDWERAFQIKVKTDNAGSSSDTEYRIITRTKGWDEDGNEIEYYYNYNYNYNVDCDSDGNNEATGITGDYICIYSVPGEYIVSITGEFPRIVSRKHSITDKYKLIEVVHWGTGKWKTMGAAFYQCSNMSSITTSIPDLSEVKNVANMFDSVDDFNLDIGNWDVSQIIGMIAMFQGASLFNQDIGSWDVSNVNDTIAMFGGASSFNQKIGNWNVSQVTDMNYMFYAAGDFNQYIGAWDVSQVTDMHNMFFYATSFNQDISNWDISKVTDMTDMLGHADSFTVENYDLMLAKWSQLDVKHNVVLTMPDGLSCNPIAKGYRTQLIRDYHWVIMDGNTDDDTDGDGLTDDEELRGGSDFNDANSFLYNGKVYKIITSSITGKQWLDRNLGASNICTSQADTTCYGDYYQWGRYPDGHEEITSSTTTTQSTSYDIFSPYFILNHNDWTSDDSSGVWRSDKWENANATVGRICPYNFGPPSINEIENELNGTNNATDVFNSFLALPTSGYRSRAINGSFQQEGNIGYIWSYSVDGVDGVKSKSYKFDSTVSTASSINRATGVPVRCIKR